MYKKIENMRETRDRRHELVFSDGSHMKVSFTVVADFSLYPGRELSEMEFEELQSDCQQAATNERAMRILSARPMSRQELYDRLLEKGETSENAETCVENLLKMHFLDDRRYAEDLVRHYRERGFGERRVKDELYRHKIPKELWEEALASNSPDEEKVREQLDAFLYHKFKGAAADRASLKKAGDALLRRGFSWEDVRMALDRYAQSVQDQFEEIEDV